MSAIVEETASFTYLLGRLEGYAEAHPSDELINMAKFLRRLIEGRLVYVTVPPVDKP